MKKITKGLFVTATVFALLTAVPATAAFAANHVENVGGGTWQWGDSSGTAYSNYYHSSKTHSATVCDGSWANNCTQDLQIKGVWAKASKPDYWVNVEKAYWNTY
ncbi:lactococcin 972 family bacteriocin [Cryobacterium suzukii]|uniref:Lactococcin 972 family bacteriocin n=1 Tax=Cryobacterium suzukii TaxID=1259198 RepID=A0A4R9ABJ2_9MICO|nr:lactococcin 972 family bacteriocin [Cryobacterium suzukii]TFD56759.1 lactococcin 972 family bacteriocin [Cryobacterium suzukii]